MSEPKWYWTHAKCMVLRDSKNVFAKMRVRKYKNELEWLTPSI